MHDNLAWVEDKIILVLLFISWFNNLVSNIGPTNSNSCYTNKVHFKIEALCTKSFFISKTQPKIYN